MNLTVLTGDIVTSSELTPDELDAIMTALDDARSKIATWPGKAGQTVTTGFARRGGDGWQMALDRPALTLRAALFVQSRLRALSGSPGTRIAAATGDGTLPPDGDLNAAHGPVFRASGRLLDGLSGRGLMAFAGGGALDASFRLADHIAQGWTQAQARAVHALLPPGSGPRRIAAEQLGISRQAIDQALWAAGFPAIKAALGQIEAAS